MLNAACSRSISDRLPSAEGGDFFFQPLQLHLEPADLLVQLVLVVLGGRGGLGPRDKQALGPGEELLLPAVDEGRVDPEVAGQLVDGAVPLEGGQGDLGLERRKSRPETYLQFGHADPAFSAKSSSSL